MGAKFSLFFLKTLGRIFLLMIIPILLASKLGWDAILPIIIYLQFLLIWAQTEISMRQTVFTSAQFEPSFDIKEEDTSIIGSDTILNVYIHNISEYPAYNLGLGRILDRQQQPVYPSNWPKTLKVNHISCLPPKQALQLYSIRLDDKERLLDDELTFEVFYSNRFGDLGTLYIKFSKRHPLLLIHERIQKPGAFLNTFEDIILLWRFYRIRRK